MNEFKITKRIWFCIAITVCFNSDYLALFNNTFKKKPM